MQVQRDIRVITLFESITSGKCYLAVKLAKAAGGQIVRAG